MGNSIFYNAVIQMELARYSMAKYIEDLNKSNTHIPKIEFLKMLKDAVREVFILIF